MRVDYDAHRVHCIHTYLPTFDIYIGENRCNNIMYGSDHLVGVYIINIRVCVFFALSVAVVVY